MKTMMVVVVLMSMVLIMSVLADNPSDLPGNGSVKVSPEAGIAVDTIRADTLLVFKEAFGYLLSGDKSEKTSFEENLRTLDKDIAGFERVARLGAEENARLNQDFQGMVTAKKAMVAAAGKMFSSYETNGTISPADASAFEVTVDALEDAKFFTNTYWYDSPGDVTGRMRMYLDILTAIQELYVYPVLPDEDEWEDFMTSLAACDEKISLFEAEYPDVSLDSLKTAKEAFNASARNMFAAMESNRTVSPEEYRAVEHAAELLDDSYHAFLNEAIKTREDMESPSPGLQETPVTGS
ncbi:MAG: hypothetical protein LUQ07_08335 [Methanospirillum sp.]|nr:hypothetical protein [Methanospirillum sp.]